MSDVKNMLGRLGYWILMVCIPASFVLVKLDPGVIPPRLEGHIQEVNALATAVATVPLMVDPPVVGTKIAREKDEHRGKDQNKKREEYESLMALMSRMQMEQAAVMKVREEDRTMIKNAIKVQGEKLEMILELTRKQEQQIGALTKKTEVMEAKANEQVKKEAGNLQRMVKMLSGIPPEKLAKIMEGIEDEPLTAILAGMKEKDVALIMTAIPAKRAAGLALRMGNFTGTRK